jgi:3-hydroxybutyryl-CoA dehydrogenase
MADIERVGIVGAGTMGSGIATNLAQHGFRVRLVDASPEAAARAQDQARAFYTRSVDKGRMRPEDAEAAAGRISVGGALEDLADSDLVIEAVFEDFGIKARLFERLSPILALDCLVATNTSCLRVSDLATHLAEPGRFLGLHYFSPAAVNPVVEVVKGEPTDERTVELALAFCAASGKQALRCKDSYGFAINRFFCPYTNEAVRALDDGVATTGEIDEAAKEVVGAAAGPFAVMNLIKPRINLHAIRNLAPLGPFYAPASSMVEVGEADRPWTIEPPAEPSPERRRRAGDYLLRGVFLPVLQALDEEVAVPADFDRGAREALKFGNGPCALMDALGRAEVERIVAPALERYGIAAPRSLGRVGSLLV